MINDYTPPTGSLDFTLLAAAVNPEETKRRLTELYKATQDFGSTLEETRRQSEQAASDRSIAEKAKEEAEAKFRDAEAQLNKALEIEQHAKDITNMLDAREADLNAKEKDYKTRLTKLKEEEGLLAGNQQLQRYYEEDKHAEFGKREEELTKREQAHQERVKRLQEAIN